MSNSEGLPEEPEINLDEWIESRLPIEDADSFFQEALELDGNHCRGDKETLFVHGLHDAAYGCNELLSGFLSENDWFQTLTKPKRQALAWILNNPQRLKATRRNTQARMNYFAHMVAELTEWCGYGKTDAVEKVISIYLNVPGQNEDEHSHDDRLNKEESLRTQIFRALGKGGKSHTYFLRQVEEIRARKP